MFNKTKAKELVQQRLRGVTKPPEKIKVMNEVLQELKTKHNFYVMFPEPFENMPLDRVSIGRMENGLLIIQYHPIMVRATA